MLGKLWLRLQAGLDGAGGFSPWWTWGIKTLLKIIHTVRRVQDPKAVLMRGTLVIYRERDSQHVPESISLLILEQYFNQPIRFEGQVYSLCQV